MLHEPFGEVLGELVGKQADFREDCVAGFDEENVALIEIEGFFSVFTRQQVVQRNEITRDAPKLRSGNDRFDLMQALNLHESGKPERTDPDQIVFERYLRRRAWHGPGNSWPDRLPFHVASQLCKGFGLLLTQGPKVRRAHAGPAEWLAAGTAGFAVLHHGPDAVRAHLKGGPDGIADRPHALPDALPDLFRRATRPRR